MLNPVTLQERLASIGDYETETEAAEEWADIIGSYLSKADIVLAPMTPPAFEAGEATAQPALLGMSAPGQGAAKIQAAFVTFWAAVVAAYGATAIIVTPPPGLAGLAALLESNFASITSSSMNRLTAAGIIAGLIHAANQGGLWSMPPLAGPIL
jgi:hypothetical protein